MFKKIHSVVVHESRLVDILKILDGLGVRVFTVKLLDKNNSENRWYVSVEVRDKTWQRIINAILDNPQFYGLCISV